MDIKEIQNKKENLEKRIFNMIKAFEKKHKDQGFLITKVNLVGDDDDSTDLTNVVVTIELKDDWDRVLKKPEDVDNEHGEKQKD